MVIYVWMPSSYKLYVHGAAFYQMFLLYKTYFLKTCLNLRKEVNISKFDIFLQDTPV